MRNTILSIIVLVLIIIGSYYYQTGFILGLILGMIAMSIFLLFPNGMGRLILDKVFNYSKNTTIMMRLESERAKTINDERKVRFKDSAGKTL